MLQCRDFWIFGYLGDPPSLSSPFSSPLLLPSILFHSAQDAQEDLPMMPMRLIVLMLKPAGRGFARNCLGARIYLGMFFFCGCNRNKLQALQFGTQEHASLSTSDPTVSVFQSRNVQTVQEPTITMVKGFRLPPIFLSSLTSITQGTQGGFQGKYQAIISRKTWPRSFVLETPKLDPSPKPRTLNSKPQTQTVNPKPKPKRANQR